MVHLIIIKGARTTVLNVITMHTGSHDLIYFHSIFLTENTYLKHLVSSLLTFFQGEVFCGYIWVILLKASFATPWLFFLTLFILDCRQLSEWLVGPRVIPEKTRFLGFAAFHFLITYGVYKKRKYRLYWNCLVFINLWDVEALKLQCFS